MPTNLSRGLAEALRQAMHARDWRQTDLAMLLNSRHQAGRLLSGENVSLATWTAVFDALDYDVALTVTPRQPDRQP